MVERTTTHVTFTVDYEVYRGVEGALAAERAAFERSLDAVIDPVGVRLAQRVKLSRALAQARRDLVRAYSLLARELVVGEPLLQPILRVMNELRDQAVQGDDLAAEMERSGGESR